jgi:predicted amino acid racemase
LTTYVGSKQYCRNPMVRMVAIKQRLNKTVAVDIHGAKQMHRYQVAIGHIGHLNQVPKHDVARVLEMHPDVITVYSVEAARRISEVAEQKGVTQELLVRVYKPGDIFFAGQEGGFREETVLEAVRQIERMPNVKVVGVTSFPCLYYNFEKSRESVHLNPNTETVTRTARRLEQELGIEIKQINAPGNTWVQTFALLKQAGATHVEPGHGLLGTTPTHIVRGNLPEKPTYVYVSEVSHHYEGRAYAFGGGLWSLLVLGYLDPSWPVYALVGTDAG